MSSNIDMDTLNALKESTGEEFFKELIDTFLQDAPNLLQQMREAVAQKDPEAFRRAAHSMKSNAATFGAMDLSTMAKELEIFGRENNLEVGNRLEVMQEAFNQIADQLKALQ